MKTLDQRLEKCITVCIYIFVTSLPFSISLNQLALSLALLAWLLRLTLTKGDRLHCLGLEWAILAFVSAELLSMAFSSNFWQSVYFLKRLLLIPIVYLIAQNLRDERQRQRVILIFIIVITVYSTLGVFSYFTTASVRVRHIHNSMPTGGLAMIGTLTCLALAAVLSRRREQWLYGLVSIPNAFCLFLTSTRSAWLGFFGGLLVMLYLVRRRWLIVVPVIIAAFYWFTPSSIAYHVRHFFNPTWGTNAERLVMWKTGWEILKDYPWVGIGDVSTQEVFQRYAPQDFTYLIGHFHNNFVQIAVTLGVIGLAAFIFLMIKILMSLWEGFKVDGKKNTYASAWTVAGLSTFVAFHICGLFEWNFGDAEVITIIWFVVGLFFSYHIAKIR